MKVGKIYGVVSAFFPLAFKTVLRISRTRGCGWPADMPGNWGIDEATVDSISKAWQNKEDN